MEVADTPQKMSAVFRLIRLQRLADKAVQTLADIPEGLERSAEELLSHIRMVIWPEPEAAARIAGGSMQVADVVKAIQIITIVKGDDESAHSLEDQLYTDVLSAIANGAENPQDLAIAALKSKLVTFARWYA